MAMKSIAVDLTTSDQDVFVMPADMSGVVVPEVTNRTGGAVTLSYKFYHQASGQTRTLMAAKSIPANDFVKFAPQSMEAGDKIIMAASANTSLTATGFASTSGSNSSKAFQGYSAYSNVVTYPLNAIVMSGNIVYLSLQAGNLNHTPSSSPSWWMELIDPADISGALIASNNFSDVPDKPTAFATIKQAATESASGVGEIATQAEAEAGAIDTAHFLTPLKGKQLFNAQQEFWMFALSDEATNIAVGTGKITFRAPYALEAVTGKISVTEAPAGSTIIVDVNKNGATMMTTNKLSIDATEKTSVTAAVAAGWTTTTIAADDEITVDIDQVGSSTPGKGLKLTIFGNRP